MDVYLEDWISFFKTHKTRLGPYDYEGSEMKHKFITNTIMVNYSFIAQFIMSLSSLEGKDSKIIVGI